jgi:hypothetical protein
MEIATCKRDKKKYAQSKAACDIYIYIYYKFFKRILVKYQFYPKQKWSKKRKIQIRIY